MTHAELRRLTFGVRAARAVMAGVSLGVFDALSQEGKPASKLARELGLQPVAAETLLDALTSLGVLEIRDGCFHNGGAARDLLTAAGPRSRRHVVLHDLWHWALWARLEDSVRSGEPAKDRSHDPFFTDPDVLRSFFPNLAHAMRETSRVESRRLAERLELSGRERVLDLGGGLGNFALELVARHPRLEVVVLDLPPVIEEARRWLSGRPGAERIQLHAADFRQDALDPSGAGFACALVSRVLMGLGDGEAEALLARIRSVLTPGGRLAVHEFVRAEAGASDPVSALLGLDMLLLTGGRVRRPSELTQLLERAGFRDLRVQEIGRSALLEARGRDGDG